MKKGKKEVIIDPADSKDGVDVVRCAHSFEVLGKSFVVDKVRYFMSTENIKSVKKRNDL